MTVKKSPRKIQKKLKLHKHMISDELNEIKKGEEEVAIIYEALRHSNGNSNYFSENENSWSKDGTSKYFANLHTTKMTKLLPVYMFNYESKQLYSLESGKSFEQTSKQVTDALKEAGIRIFTIIDHAKLAKKSGMKLRPTKLIIFGNPKVGTSLMQQDQRVGIDLPLKILIWEDKDNRVWITLKEPVHILENYNLMDVESSSNKIKSIMKMFGDNGIASV